MTPPVYYYVYVLKNLAIVFNIMDSAGILKTSWVTMHLFPPNLFQAASLYLCFDTDDNYFNLDV